MLSSRNEWILVGALIFYLAFVPRLQMVRELLSTSVGKAAALAAIVYVYKYVSCSAALLLVVAYVRCGCNIREMMENPSTITSLPNIPAVMPGTPISTTPPTSGPGAPINTMPPNTAMSTAPMTTPMPTMPPVPNTMINPTGGFQPSMNSSSSVSAPV